MFPLIRFASEYDLKQYSIHNGVIAPFTALVGVRAMECAPYSLYGALTVSIYSSRDQPDLSGFCHQCYDLDCELFTDPDGNPICEDCEADNVAICTSCSESAWVDDTRSTPDGDTVCESCFDRHYATCCSCNDVIQSDDARNSGRGDTYCYECYCDAYTSCCDCGEELDREYAHYHDGEAYCEGCEPRGVVHDYSYRPRLNFHSLPNERVDRKTIYLGVELETHGSADPDDILDALGADEYHAYLKSDSSIDGDNAAEIVTHPHTLEAHRKFWRDYFDHAPRGVRSWEGGSCGCHVHISRKSAGPYTWGKVLQFVNDPINRRLVETVAQRSGSSWAAISPKKISDIRGYIGRYQAINIENSHTIEFRIFRGSHRYDRVMKNIEFAHSVLCFARITAPSDLTAANYLAWLKRGEYPELHAFLADAGMVSKPKVRRIAA